MVKVAKTFEKDAAELRTYFCSALIELAKDNEKIVDLEADLMGAGGLTPFKQAYPDRSFNVGIAEQSMIGIAAGLSVAGFIPFAHTFGAFATRRPLDQIYISCAYSHQNVKIVGSDPGITGAPNGGTHQAMEDIAILRPIPDITILEPCDPVQMKWAAKTAAQTKGLFYIRMHRKQCTSIYEEGSEFEVGKGAVVKAGSDATIFTTGAVMMEESLKAAEQLEKAGISVRVVDLVSIKPIDEELIVKCAKEAGAVLVAENHFSIGGVTSAVAEVLVNNRVAVPFDCAAVKDAFGEVGTVDSLLERFEMRGTDIAEKIKALVSRK